MKRRHVLAGLITVLGASLALAAGSPVGTWKTVDDKSGRIKSTVEIYEESGKVFGRIASLTEPNDKQGRPKTASRARAPTRTSPSSAS